MKDEKKTMKGDFTVAELSKKMGISTRTIHNYIKKGKLKSYKKNNKLFFPKDQFENKEQVSEAEVNTEGSPLEKQLRKEIEGLNKDKEFLQEQLKSQTELARNEQHLKAQLQDKLDKVLLLNSPEANRPEGNIYDAQPIKGEKAPHKKTPTTKKKAPKNRKKETKTQDLKAYRKSDKIKDIKHKKGFWSWFTGS